MVAHGVAMHSFVVRVRLCQGEFKRDVLLR